MNRKRFTLRPKKRFLFQKEDLLESKPKSRFEKDKYRHANFWLNQIDDEFDDRPSWNYLNHDIDSSHF